MILLSFPDQLTKTFIFLPFLYVNEIPVLTKYRCRLPGQSLDNRGIIEVVFSSESTARASPKQSGSPLLEIARVFVRFDHVTRFIINPSYSIV
jgi:hypothetical protein